MSEDLRTFLKVRRDLEMFLNEDIGRGDITSSMVKMPSNVSAEIVCKSKTQSVVAGLEEAKLVFEMCGCRTVTFLSRDGAVAKKGDRVLRVDADPLPLLRAERTALNLMMRMSGISTRTKELVRSVNGRVSILATRKTAPGLRYFDKKAVVLGGGKSHRMGLDDAVLIKDNHIKLAGGARACVEQAREKLGSAGSIECEVGDTAEAIEAIRAGANVIMLDNFTPVRARQTIRILEQKRIRNDVQIELSGGITPENIKEYAAAGADSISLGFLTHSAKAVDYSLEIISR